MQIVRATFRAIVFFLGGLFMMLRIGVMDLLKGRDFGRAIRYRLHFLRWLIPALGVKIEYIGEAPRDPGLIMCNHRSFFDPIPVLNQVWAVPVGKAEVRKWPIIGLGGEMSGTIYVDRKTSDGRQAARDSINQRLKDGFSILIYPEGTIFPGPELGEVKKGMFRDAAKFGYTIHPVAIEYKYAADTWLGRGFVSHFYSRFGKKNIFIKTSYGPAMTDTDPVLLRERFEDWLNSEIGRMRADWFVD